MASASEKNPLHHTQKMKKRLEETVTHLRQDIEKVAKEARGYFDEIAANFHGDYFAVLGRIREIFDAEWDSPTDIARGKLTEKPPTDEPNA